MLDPRIIRERRDEIVHSCRIRHVKADVDAVLAEQEKTNALLTELNEANRTRNEHQKSGKRKMEDAEREAHKEEGRALFRAVRTSFSEANTVHDTAGLRLLLQVSLRKAHAHTWTPSKLSPVDACARTGARPPCSAAPTP